MKQVSDSKAADGRSPTAEERELIAGRYRIDAPLGEGGMAVVYRGWHVRLDQPIAIKVLREEFANHSEVVSRFLREARAGAKLRGRHVAQVLDIGRAHNGAPFMVTELLQGCTLGQLLATSGPLPVARAVELLVLTTEAVQEAHDSGIVHRDLKPDNLFLTEDDDGDPIVKVLDFGVAKRLDHNEPDNTKSTLGSPHYMAPEQILHPAEVDARADVWSLGVVLYELLTGRVPFEADTIPEILRKSLRDACPPPRQHRPGVPDALEEVVLRCLSKRRETRISSALELKQALLAAVTREPSAVPEVNVQPAAANVEPTAAGATRAETEAEIPIVSDSSGDETGRNADTLPAASRALPPGKSRLFPMLAAAALTLAAALVAGHRWQPPPEHFTYAAMPYLQHTGELVQQAYASTIPKAVIWLQESRVFRGWAQEPERLESRLIELAPSLDMSPSRQPQGSEPVVEVEHGTPLPGLQAAAGSKLPRHAQPADALIRSLAKRRALSRDAGLKAPDRRGGARAAELRAPDLIDPYPDRR